MPWSSEAGHVTPKVKTEFPCKHCPQGYNSMSGLYKHMNIFRPRPASRADLTAFHSDDYIRFLSDVTPDSLADLNPGGSSRRGLEP